MPFFDSNKRIFRLPTRAIAMCLATACSGEPSAADADRRAAELEPFDEEAVMVGLSESGELTFELRSRPEALPVRGSNRVELLITQTDDGAPVDHLELQMVPFMPAMGHGSGAQPDGVNSGDGRYEFDGVLISMPGMWELRTTIGGAHEDYVSPSFDVR